jgi:hypothetical protein
MCPTLLRVLELERDAWYGKISPAAGDQSSVWQKTATRLSKMLGEDYAEHLLDYPEGLGTYPESEIPRG